MQEENLPLIPKPVDTVNHDVEHVLRDIFQDVLEKAKYPKNIAKNLLKNNIQCAPMKDGAKSVENIINYSLLSMEDVGIVEEKIMYRQGQYLLHNIRKTANTCNTDVLKREVLMKPLEPSVLRQYGLLEGGDLLPDNFLKAMDFTLNENEHKCKPCISQLLFLENKLSCGKRIYEDNFNFKEDTRIKVERNRNFTRSPFHLSANKVIFCNYDLNKTYKKRIRLTNVSNTMQVFNITTYPKNKYFSIDIEDIKNTAKICPGLSVKFLVTFKADDYLDIQDTLVLSSTLGDGTKTYLTVLIASYRNAPNLYIYICKQVFPIKCSLATFDIGRAVALNNSIDCGACFLSKNIQTSMIVKNNGGNGKFFFMSEENWFDFDVNTLHKSLELEVGNFIISPAYFEILSQEYIQIKIVFRTKSQGVNLEKVVLLCNNATYEKLDLIADGIVFDRYCLSIKEEGLLPQEHLDYILYVPVDEPVSLAAIGEDDVYDKDIKELKDALGYNYGSCGFFSSTSNDATSNESQHHVDKSASQDVITYLKNTGQGIIDCEFVQHEKYHYKYLLFFESAVPFKRNQKIITINNICTLVSLVDLHYYWKIEDTGSEKMGYSNLKNLNGKCLDLNLTPESSLPSYSTTEFEIVLIPDFCDEGFYRLALNMYIKEVPICAVNNPENFNIIYYPDSDLVDILIATFEVVCRIAPIIIEFSPPKLTLNKSLKYGECHDFMLYVNASTENKEPMECKWIIENENINIIPNEMIMEDDQNIIFTITLYNTGYDDITESLEFNVDNIYKKILPIDVKVERPTLKFQHDVLNFGSIQIGNKYSFKFFILNDNYVSVDWDIWENFNEDLVSNNVDLIVRNLEDHHIEIEYIIDAQEEVSWESQLQIFTTYNNEKRLDNTCLLIYNVSKLSVMLHTPMSQCPILSPKEILYINTKYTYTLCLHNFSNISTYYFFGEPYGAKSDLLNVNIVRSVGLLEAGKIVQVNIEIVPKSVGVIDDVYVPCHFKQCNCFLKGEEVKTEAIHLVVLYVAEDIYVKVKLPVNRSGIKDVIIWPPQMVYDFDYEFIDYENVAMPEGEEEEEADIHSKRSDLVHHSEVDLNGDISKYLNSIMYPCVEETDYDLNLLVPQNSQETSELSSDSGITEISNESLVEGFHGKDFVIQDHVIEVFDVPLHKLITKSIVIENCTSIEGTVNVETVNFNPVVVNKKKIDELLEEMNFKKVDDFDKMLTEHGIWIKVETDDNKLAPFGKINIRLLIYASTWGTYVEELMIEINEILPLCISVVVDVVGLPLEFANFKNSLQKYPLLRFGTIPYKTKPVKRKIYFKNVSSVPINITWHIFLKTKDRNDKPLTLVFDIFHPNLELKLSEHDSMGNLMVMFGKYFKNKEQYIFNIEPKETFVSSGETTFLDVSFDPRAYGANFKQKKVEAYLIGYVQIAQKFQYLPNAYLRKFGSQMTYLKMKLSATLELPILLLELVKGDLKFVYYACDVIDFDCNPLTKNLCLKNFQTSKAAVQMFCDEPLVIESMETISGKSSNNAVVVGPNESVDVKICYNINSDYIKTVAETLYNVNYDPDISTELDLETYSHKIVRYINIKQKGVIKQNFPIEIITYYPLLEMTSELEFGFVFIGNNKKQILTIWNYTSCPVPYRLETTGELIINPSIGIIGSAKHIGPSHVDISVIFIPKVYKNYLETIFLTTNVPGLVRTASVRGIGVHDEKHFSHDLC